MPQANHAHNGPRATFTTAEMDEAEQFLSTQLGPWHLVLLDYWDAEDQMQMKFANLYAPLFPMSGGLWTNTTQIEFLPKANKYAVIGSGFVGDYLGMGDTVLEAIKAALPVSGEDVAFSPDEIAARNRRRQHRG